MKKKGKNIRSILLNKRKKRMMIFLSVLLLGIFFFFITFSNIYTQTYQLERFETANETIHSPITIEHEEETERKTRQALQAVGDKFFISEEITQEQLDYMNEIFDAVSIVEEEYNQVDQTDEDLTDTVKRRRLSQQFEQILSSEITESLDMDIFIQLMEIPESERERGQKLFIQSLEEIMEDGVRTENTQYAITQLEQDILDMDLGEDIKEILMGLSGFAVTENSFFDVEETMEAQKEVASNVQPVTIQAGEVIVNEGQTITNEIYEVLELVGLLDEDRNIYPVIGLGLFILLICTVLALEMNRLEEENQLDKAKVLSVFLISIIVVVIMKVSMIYYTPENNLYFLVPAAIGGLLVKLLIQERLAIVLASLYAILASIIFNGEIQGALNIEAAIYFFFSQLAGIFLIRNVTDRLAILKAGAGILIVNIMTIVVFLFLSFEKYSLVDVFTQLGYGAVSAFLSVVLTMGLLPVFETSLGMLSDIKLLQLANPKQPLLKKILTEAPGTYHHSIMVANISETACEAIGANGLLARVGAYYHDVGKTIQPQYFIENQMGDRNPHDLIEPAESANVIIRHTTDGAKLLTDYKLPKEIVHIALEHHGTTLLKYFYYKAKEQGNAPNEEDYRYPGPKPQTKESAIINICDSVEAAVRSLHEPTEEKIEEIVTSIIKDRMMDGQFDECALTFQELKIVREAICGSLKGIFHSRIQYPTKEEK